MRPAQRPYVAGLLIVLYGTVCAAFAAFVVYHNQNLVASTIDVNGFGLLSRNLALGRGFSLGYGESIRRAPLYPAVGAVLLKIFGGAEPGTSDAVTYQPIIVFQCVIFGLTCLLTWLTARRLFGPRVALVAVLLCPLIPQSLRYVGQTEVETITGFFIALLAYSGLRLFERPAISSAALFGLTAAAATLTKPVTQLYPFVVLALLWGTWWIQSRRSSHREHRDFGSPGRIAVVTLACFALPLVPWLIRDWVVTNGQFIGVSSNAPGETLRGYVAVQPKYVLLRDDFADWDPEANTFEENLLNQQGVPFYHWNSPSAGSFDVQPPIPPGVTSAMLDAQKDQIESAALSSRVRQQPVEFVAKFVLQLVTFWYLVVSRTQSLVVGAIAAVVLALSVMGVLRARHRWPLVVPVVAIIVYSNMIYASTLAMARYSMPLYPTLMILAAGGLAAFVPRRLTVRLLMEAPEEARPVHNSVTAPAQLSLNRPGP